MGKKEKKMVESGENVTVRKEFIMVEKKIRVKRKGKEHVIEVKSRART